MKKLLVIVLFMMSLMSFSQTTFVRNYTSFIVERDYVKESEKLVTLTVIYNPNGENKVVFKFGDGRTRNFYQVSKVENGKTEGGYEYQLMNVVDDDGEEVVLQLFDKNNALRIIVSEGNTIEFYK